MSSGDETAMTFDPSQDFAGVLDGLQTVTLVRPGSSAATTVPHALCRAVKTREMEPSQGQYTAADVAWHLPASETPEAPRPGDVIVDARDRRWTILTVRAATLASRWRCLARDLALAHGLDAAVRIEKATPAKSESGAEQLVWRLWLAGVRARIQPAERQVATQHEQLSTAAAFTLLVAEDLAIDHTCRVRGPDGKIYRVLGYRKAQRIDALSEIDVMLEG